MSLRVNNRLRPLCGVCVLNHALVQQSVDKSSCSDCVCGIASVVHVTMDYSHNGIIFHICVSVAVLTENVRFLKSVN